MKFFWNQREGSAGRRIAMIDLIPAARAAVKKAAIPSGIALLLFVLIGAGTFFSRAPQKILAANPVLTQQDFRVYANVDAVTPTSALAIQNASATNIVSGQVVRIRIGVAVTSVALATSTQAFKLQYAPKGGAGSCTSVPSGNFADVGAAGSSSAWRGFNNASTTDGAALTGTLLSSSTAAESYVEQNPTPSNTRMVAVNGEGEWDFVVQNNDASSSAAYCFRMLTSAGAALDAYSADPEIDTIPSATWRASQNTPTSTIEDTSVRLRMEISNNGNASDSGSFRLEFATSTAGPWTTVPVDSTCMASTAAFRECPSGYFADLDPTHNLLTPAASLFISGFMLENTNPAPLLSLGTNQFTELEWNIQATQAASFGQTYYFRASDAGTPIGTYSVYPQLTVAAASSTYTQNYYRWYANANALKSTDPWPTGAPDLGENTAITGSDAPPKSGDVLRLRMAVTIGTASLPTSTQAFKLQYGTRATTCGAISSWTDVGAIGGSGAWRGYDNTSVTDGTALSTDPPTGGDLVLSVSNRSGRYGEANPSATNPYKAWVGDNVEYDWALQDNATTSAGSYCFRMVKSDGTAFGAYTYYPTVTTAAFAPQSAVWRFYDDENNETPSTPLAGENVAPSDVLNGNIVKLRVAVKETNGVNGGNVKFKVQFSQVSNFSSGVSDVAETGSCTTGSQWCYATSTGGTDNAVITTKVLSGSDACSGSAGNGCGTHNTSGTSTSTFSQAASAMTEYEFTLKGNGASGNTTYFFRLANTADGSPVPLYSTSSYPSAVTEGSLLTFSIGGLPQGTSTDGVVTSVSSTPTSISFGTLTVATSVTGAQRLVISTNAPNGFELYALQDSPLMNGQGYTMPAVAATNGSPLPWSSACTASSTACYGYHTGSPVLSGGSTRFAANDTYAALTTAPAEIGYSGIPSTSTIDVVYRVQAGATQVNGAYQHNIVYIAAPIF